MEFPKNWIPIFFCFADVYVIASQIAIKMLKWSRYVEFHMRQVRNCENKGEELMAELAQVIKYEGDNSTFVWKHPMEDFNTSTQLIVHESQEAIFFMNGQALDLFGPGRHTLETQNIPLLKRLINISTGSQTPFHCEVYFVNKTEQMAVKWGTDSKVQFMEPKLHFPLQIGASGEMTLMAEDARKLLVKIVGTEKNLGQQALVQKFRAVLMTKVKSYLAKTIRENEISIFEIDEHLDQISQDLHQWLIPDFLEYGVSLERFFVTTVVRPEGDRDYEKYKELYFKQYGDVKEAQIRQQVEIINQQTKAQQMIIESQALATKRSQEGYSYQQERGFDVAEKVAANEAVGQFTNMGVGLGTMAGVGGAIGGVVGGAINNAIDSASMANSSPASTAGFCENCGSPITQEMEFCEQCGHKLKANDKCSNCGFVFKNPGKFCPKCGSKREVAE